MRWLARKLLVRIVRWAWGREQAVKVEIIRWESDPSEILLYIRIPPISFYVPYEIEEAFEFAEAMRNAAYAAIAND